MSQWSVLTDLRQILVLDEKGAAEALPLCSSCLEEICGQLREDVDPSDGRVSRAAAGLAYYRLVLRRVSADDGVTVFKAGDVSVSKGTSDSLRLAEKVRDEALSAALPLMRDEKFWFGQVIT